MNRKTVLLSSVFIPLFLFVYANISFALNTSTHEDINDYVASSTIDGFSLSNYLNSNLGFSKGKDEIILSQEVYKWLRDGGKYEDVPVWYLPYLRSVNHFYNPINKGGFTGIFDTGFLSGMPAYDWATRSQNTQSPGGYYSWDDVRGYYLNALTSTTQDDRNKNFAQTFRGLGQLMHLVEDMSVPEHTRNDGHYLPYGDYENWVSRPRNVSIATLKPIFFCSPLSSIKSLFDTAQYVKNPNTKDPGTTAHLSNTINGTCSNIGLSEFTNANFLTDDTIFSGFTYPRIEDTELWTDPTNNRDYLRKLAISPTDGSATGISVDHLAASSLLYFYRWRYYPQTKEYLPLGLDSKVYADYSSLLLPRAAGYSADLLKYFLRGEINMVNTSGQYYIENHSSENMSGTFSIYYDDTKGNRIKITSWDNLSIDAEKNNTPGKSNPVTFKEPTDAKEKGKYILVFEGMLGDENDAVVGKVVPLNPPSYVFIVQDETVLNSPPPVENVFTWNFSSWNGPYIYVTDVKAKQWDISRQYFVGHFKPYGTIQKISVQSLYTAAGNIKFYINDKLVNGNTWIKDNNSDDPLTWRVEGTPWGAYGAYKVKLMVTMADGSVFSQGLLTYLSAAQNASKSIQLPAGWMGGYTCHAITLMKINWLSITGYTTNTSSSFPFEVVKMAGHTPSENYSTQNIGSLSCGEEQSISGQVYSYNDGLKFFNFDQINVGGFDVQPTPQGTPYQYVYNSTPIPEYLPSLDISASFKRVYSQNELEKFKQLGIEPVDYVVNFR